MIDTDALKRRWQMVDADRISAMAQRIELTLCWNDLDALITDSVSVIRNPNGVWSARSTPAERGRLRHIRQSAINALIVCARDDGRLPVYSTQNVKAAKKLCRDAFMAFALPAEA